MDFFFFFFYLHNNHYYPTNPTQQPQHACCSLTGGPGIPLGSRGGHDLAQNQRDLYALMSNNQLNSKRLRRLAKKGDKNAALTVREESKSEKRKRQIGYAFLFIFGLGLSQFVLVVYSWFVPNYVRLSVDDPAQLKEVFFGGKPYLVLCNDGKQAVHSIFTEVSRSVSYSREFKTAILDCNQKLPSGKTTLEASNRLPKKSKKHLALVFYNGNKRSQTGPVQLFE